MVPLAIAGEASAVAAVAVPASTDVVRKSRLFILILPIETEPCAAPRGAGSGEDLCTGHGLTTGRTRNCRVIKKTYRDLRPDPKTIKKTNPALLKFQN
jgi:hypothetical protein